MIGVPFDQPVLIADRFNAQVTLTKDNKTYEKSFGSRFVFGLKAELDSENLFVKGTFAAVLNDGFEINGPHLIVHALGYTATAQQIVKLSENPFLGDHVRADGRSCKSKFFESGTGPLIEYLFIPHATELPEEQGHACRVGFVLGGEGILYHKPEAALLSPGSAFILQRYERFHLQTHVNPLGLLIFNCDPRS